MKSGFKSTINWNKNKLKVTTHRRNRYLDYLIDPSFPGVHRLFVLSFECITRRKRHTRYFLLKAEKILKSYDRWRKRFQSTSKHNLRIYDNIRKITTGQRDYYTTGCLLDFPYFKKHCKMIATDLSKQEALDPNIIQQINFTGDLN